MGLAQYTLDSAVFHDDFSWPGALIATGLGALGGLASVRGAQHFKSIGSNLDDTGRTGVKAILTAFDKYGAGSGYQKVLNLWGGRVANALANSISQNFTKSVITIWGTTAATYGVSYLLGKMELVYLVGTTGSILLISFAMCLDTRRPISTKLKYKYRVNDNSIFRKIIKFKDQENNPCNYFKVVPFYVFLLLSILSLILLFIDIFFNRFITNAVPKEILITIMICILGISILYFLVISIWWEIVDYNEFKFTKEEKKELKQLRKFIKENKKNK